MDMSNGELTTNQHEELRLLYNVTAADLAFFKRQQWVVTNYALLLYAVIVAVGKQLLSAPVAAWEKILLGILAGATAISAGVIVSQLQESIKVRRARLEKLRSQFSKEFQEAWAALEKPSDYVVPVLYAVIVIGLGIVWWVLSRG